MKFAYGRLLNATGRVVGQAKRFSKEISTGVKHSLVPARQVVAADAGFYSAKNEAAARAKNVKRVCLPNRSSKSAAGKREQKKRWFRNGQRWRTGATDASASASVATVSTVAATEMMKRCGAGSVPE